MENIPIAAYVTLGLACIALIVWLVRLEGKTNQTASNLDEETETADEVHTSILRELKEVKIEFYRHVADSKAHHNEEANREFRNGLERRLDTMEAGITDIGRKLNHMAGRD